MLSTDVAGNVTYLNPTAERMTGWLAKDAVGKPLDEVMHIIDADSREPVRNPLAEALSQDAIAGLPEHCLLVRHDGSESAIEDTATPVHDPQGRMTGAVIVFRDVGAARALSLRMSHLAQHDVLTGLPNRLLLTDRLDRAIASAFRHGSSLAVLFMDLDHFKQINDQLGHAAGDLVLQSVARRMESRVRGSDTVSRHGGDEFVVLLTDVYGPGAAALSAAKLQVAIGAAHRIGDHDLHVTASVGISLYPADGTDSATLLNKADLALLRAKAHRRPWPSLAMAAAPARASSK